jgi:hypothetical protein
MQAGGGYTEGGESDETREMYGSERSTDQHLEESAIYQRHTLLNSMLLVLRVWILVQFLFPFALIRAARQWALLLAIDSIVYKTRHEMKIVNTRGLRVESTHTGLGHGGTRQCGDAKEYRHVCRCRVVDVVNEANRRCSKKNRAPCQPCTASMCLNKLRIF